MEASLFSNENVAFHIMIFQSLSIKPLTFGIYISKLWTGAPWCYRNNEISEYRE